MKRDKRERERRREKKEKEMERQRNCTKAKQEKMTVQYLRFQIALPLDVLCDGHERLLVDPGVARLVEGEDPDPESRVLLDDLVRLLVGVEGVHEDEWDVGVVLLVEGLDLLHRQVKEGQVVAEGDHGLRALMGKREIIIFVFDKL